MGVPDNFGKDKSYRKKNIVLNCKWNSTGAQDTIWFKQRLWTAQNSDVQLIKKRKRLFRNIKIWILNFQNTWRLQEHDPQILGLPVSWSYEGSAAIYLHDNLNKNREKVLHFKNHYLILGIRNIYFRKWISYIYALFKNCSGGEKCH